MFSCIRSLGLNGLACYEVSVETDLSNGMPAFEIVGLPDMAVREARDRVRAAVKNCGYQFPVGRITVNLAPADVKKSGPVYDLAVLLGILSASSQIGEPDPETAFIGELSLQGQLRPVQGALSMVLAARDAGFARVVVPAENRYEAGVVSGIEVLPATTVPAVIAHLSGACPLEAYHSTLSPEDSAAEGQPDFSEVKGQEGAKRALEIAAAGGHNLLMVGPPGSGKSMLAKRLPSILPEMSFEESLRTTEIHSAAGILPAGTALIRQRPFRAPHHTVSPYGLSGGGAFPRPGEISLAHNGVLFLDELPEFGRAALEILRQPLEDGQVTVSRVSGTVTFPCSFMTVAAMNPCRCGYRGHPTRPCTCSDAAAARYLSRISGPLLDRFDLHIEVLPVNYDELTDRAPGEDSAKIRARVNRARAIQRRRLEALEQAGQLSAGTAFCNAQLSQQAVAQVCRMSDGAQTLLRNAFEQNGLSARAYSRVLKVARTIADLADSDRIEEEQVLEAIQYRSLESKYWGK